MSILRLTRLRRIGVSGAVASAVAELAFGPARRGDVVALIAATAERVTVSYAGGC